MSNGSKVQVSAFQAVVTTAVVSVTFLGLLWSFISEVDRKYLPRMAHDDFIRRFEGFRDATRIDINDAMSRREFINWKLERDKRFEKLERDAEGASTRIEQAMRDRASLDSLTALQRQLDLMRDSLRELSAREESRHMQDRRP